MCTHSSTDHERIRTLALDAQRGNIPAATALKAMIDRIAATMEEPMQHLISDPPPDDAPGQDCPDHGPTEGDCPKCSVGNCIQYATHEVNGVHVCCFHYSEELTGVLCGCTDDDWGDAMAEQAMGTYNGHTPLRLAVTRQSIQIESTMRRCHNCGADHRTWQCPEIASKLFAPEQSWKDIALGRELCRMRWRNFTAFVALLMSVPAEHLVIYAESYIAFIRDYNPTSDLLIRDVLKTWARIIADEGGRGPAAPALKLVA